ncbi:phosphatidylinositol 4-kinase gamma 8-like [Cornus florida]|uniref:phosphatidylinositol 4-kinase gamma 8-like n=1 Tax=Cornus florida TaxID=4283 RepID=UPI002899C2A8|nr:phosphatidylinositol 4-kinase gamma 8-like [Cornus florida]
MAVVVDQNHGFKPFVRPPRCRLQSYSQLDHTMLEFTQNSLVHSLKQAVEVTNIHRSFSTPCLSLGTRLEEECSCDANPRIEIICGHGAPKVYALVVEVAIAMASGVSPVPATSGLGGAYILHGRNGEAIAVAKPMDEEPLALNNPKGFAGPMLGQPGMKRSIRVGETGLRELAAYLLDHGGFAGVPPTALVKISHVAFHVNNSEAISAPPYKIASLQRFVDHDSDAGDLGPSGFSVASIHRIGILDVRLLNLDRHAGNILVKHGHESYAVGAAELVPIDHGLCLPESLDDPYFEWLHWPQAGVPFSDSEIEYISNLDPYKDAELLRTEIPSLRESSIRILVLCTILLKGAVAAGLCLADIGEMMSREFCGGEEKFSVLENLCLLAKNCMSSMSNNGSGNDDQGKEELEMFQFDYECEDSSNQVIELPKLLQSPAMIGKPPKFSYSKSMSGLLDSTALLTPLNEEYDRNAGSIYIANDGKNNDDDDDNNDDDGDGSEDDHKLGCLMKSMSFSVPNCNHESESISFGEMIEEEWELFLESFEQILPEAFESIKSMGLLKQRLGTSCKF